MLAKHKSSFWWWVSPYGETCMGKQFQQSKKQGTEEERTFQVLPFLSEFSKLVLVTVTYIDSWAHSQINQSDSLGAKCKDL